MTKPPERLYGLEGSERLHDDPAGVWECDIDASFDDGPWVIEEWTVRAPLDMVRGARFIIEDLHEWFCDDYAEWDCPFETSRVPIEQDETLLLLAEALRSAFASKIPGSWADQIVDTHVLTLVDDEPHLDGEPLYRKVHHATDQ